MLISSPEKVGMSTSRLKRISDLTSSYVDSGKLAGTVSLVMRRGEVIHFECKGVQNLKTGQPMTEDTIFGIYSMTKPITSIAIMMLYERGFFQLDTPVSKFIPEFKNLQVYESGTIDDYTTVKPLREMNIRDLLTHTAGLVYGLFNNTVVDQLYDKNHISSIKAESLGSFVKKISEMPLLYSPGTKWSYSVATDVLGYIIEVITGKGLNVFFKEEIFNPLDMNHTDFYIPEEKLGKIRNQVHKSR
jgi:CubicO group peptidase (beta-lactamase class C family)